MASLKKKDAYEAGFCHNCARMTKPDPTMKRNPSDSRLECPLKRFFLKDWTKLHPKKDRLDIKKAQCTLF